MKIKKNETDKVKIGNNENENNRIVKKIYIGKSGEDIAQKYFLDSGFTILDTNWRATSKEVGVPRGELDIILIDTSKNSEIVFAEVKTRTTLAYGLPEQAVTRKKYFKIKTLAIQWIKENQISLREMGIITNSIRVDVVGILQDKSHNTISHLQSVY